MFFFNQNMFWLSYESFSIFTDVFCQKGSFPAKTAVIKENWCLLPYNNLLLTLPNCCTSILTIWQCVCVCVFSFLFVSLFVYCHHCFFILSCWCCYYSYMLFPGAFLLLLYIKKKGSSSPHSICIIFWGFALNSGHV